MGIATRSTAQTSGSVIERSPVATATPKSSDATRAARNANRPAAAMASTVRIGIHETSSPGSCRVITKTRPDVASIAPTAIQGARRSIFAREPSPAIGCSGGS